MGKRRVKRDAGIAIVDAKMSTGQTKSFKIQEAVRDALNKKAQNREFKVDVRGSFDNMTTQELEQHQFSGFRLNHLSNRIELWVLGMIACSERADRAARDPRVLANMHEKVFATKGSIIEMDINHVQGVIEREFKGRKFS